MLCVRAVTLNTPEGKADYKSIIQRTFFVKQPKYKIWTAMRLVLFSQNKTQFPRWAGPAWRDKPGLEYTSMYILVDNRPVSSACRRENPFYLNSRVDRICRYFGPFSHRKRNFLKELRHNGSDYTHFLQSFTTFSVYQIQYHNSFIYF